MAWSVADIPPRGAARSPGPLWVNNGPPVRKPVLRRAGMDRAIERLWAVSERETGVALSTRPPG